MTVSLSDFTPPLPNWQTVTELSFTPAREDLEGKKKVPVAGTPWKGPRDMRNLHWEGGEYTKAQSRGAVLTTEEHQKAFDEAIRKSLDLEKTDRK